MGHRCIAHVDGGRGAGAAPRRAGYIRAMRSHGLADEVHVVTGDFTEEAGASGVRQLLHSTNPPTAIFTANDLSAVGALDQIEAGGLVVPDDISVVGFDNTALAALNHISLTTIDQPRAQMGAAAAGMLIDVVLGRAHLSDCVMTPRLVVRGTTGQLAR